MMTNIEVDVEMQKKKMTTTTTTMDTHHVSQMLSLLRGNGGYVLEPPGHNFENLLEIIFKLIKLFQIVLN